MTKSKRSRRVFSDYQSTEAKWQTTRNHIETFKRRRAEGSKQSIASYAQENGLKYDHFQRAVSGNRPFPATWEESLSRRGQISRNIVTTADYVAKADKFAADNIDTELGADLTVAFKAEFSELYADWDDLSDKAKQNVWNKKKSLGKKIKKLRAKRNSLAAAASSVAEHDSDNDDSDDDGDFL